MRSLNKYKITRTNQEVEYVSAHDFDIVGSCIIFTESKVSGNPFAAGIHKEKVLAISGGSVISIELVKADSDDE